MSTRNSFSLSRRHALQWLGALTAGLSGLQAIGASTHRRVVIVGGGFGGSSFARHLKALTPSAKITLVDQKKLYTACPFSNLVISGHRNISAQQFNWQALIDAGIEVVNDAVTQIDTSTRQISLADSSTLNYDKLIMAPGIRLLWNEIEGYDEAASGVMPHAWQAGKQTLLLRNQLNAMPENGVVAISAPENPYRCPPGPYERAGLIANYLLHHKPKAKLLILDAKDSFSKKELFQSGWQALYGDLIEWRGLSDSGKVNRVDTEKKLLHTDFDSITADVANIIPPQAAGQIAEDAGLTDATGWCPIDPVTFASTLASDAHVLGDAAIANAMPKSAFAANAQAKVCAIQLAREFAGQPPLSSTLINTCYSLLAPDYGISVAGVYRPGEKALNVVEGSGGTSPLAARPSTRALEARYARSWFNTITKEAFG